MSIRAVSAAEWNTARGVLNTLISKCNTVHISSTTGTVTPSVSLESPGSTVSRIVSEDEIVGASDHSDGDGIVTKYNFMREYDSCRRLDSGNVWHYGQTITSSDPAILGRRDGSFTATAPPTITPPSQGDRIQNIIASPPTDILEIITSGSAIHDSTLFPGAGSEFVVINECHVDCHSSCHSSCHRNRR